MYILKQYNDIVLAQWPDGAFTVHEQSTTIPWSIEGFATESEAYPRFLARIGAVQCAYCPDAVLEKHMASHRCPGFLRQQAISRALDY